MFDTSFFNLIILQVRKKVRSMCQESELSEEQEHELLRTLNKNYELKDETN